MPQRKILRDNIRGITKPSLKRMTQSAGVKSVETNVYEELRGLLKADIDHLLLDTITVMEHERMKTVKPRHVEKGIMISDGQKMAYSKKVKSTQCKVPKKTAYRKPRRK